MARPDGDKMRDALSRVNKIEPSHARDKIRDRTGAGAAGGGCMIALLLLPLLAALRPLIAGRPCLDDHTEEVIRRVVDNAGELSDAQMDRISSLLPPVELPVQPTGEAGTAA